MVSDTRITKAIRLIIISLFILLGLLGIALVLWFGLVYGQALIIAGS